MNTARGNIPHLFSNLQKLSPDSAPGLGTLCEAGEKPHLALGAPGCVWGSQVGQERQNSSINTRFYLYKKSSEQCQAAQVLSCTFLRHSLTLFSSQLLCTPSSSTCRGKNTILRALTLIFCVPQPCGGANTINSHRVTDQSVLKWGGN